MSLHICAGLPEPHHSNKILCTFYVNIRCDDESTQQPRHNFTTISVLYQWVKILPLRCNKFLNKTLLVYQEKKIELFLRPFFLDNGCGKVFFYSYSAKNRWAV